MQAIEVEPFEITEWFNSLEMTCPANYHVGQGIWKICTFNGIEKDARRSKSAEL